MNNDDIGKTCRVLMKDGFAKTGIVLYVGAKSVTLQYFDGSKEEIFFDAVASIRVNR